MHHPNVSVQYQYDPWCLGSVYTLSCNNSCKGGLRPQTWTDLWVLSILPWTNLYETTWLTKGIKNTSLGKIWTVDELNAKSQCHRGHTWDLGQHATFILWVPVLWCPWYAQDVLPKRKIKSSYKQNDECTFSVFMISIIHYVGKDMPTVQTMLW